jgi:uncharacterized membrane protein
MTEPTIPSSTPPKAVALIRPCIYAGALISILGASLVSGRFDFGFDVFWNIMVLTLGVAIMIFGVLAAMAWRIAKTANETAIAEAKAGIVRDLSDDEDDD